jgi:hypothetical protein
VDTYIPISTAIRLIDSSKAVKLTAEDEVADAMPGDEPSKTF